MQIRATIIKLINSYDTKDILGHIANEVESDANHMETVGAPRRAAYYRALVKELRESSERIEKIEY